MSKHRAEASKRDGALNRRGVTYGKHARPGWRQRAALLVGWEPAEDDALDAHVAALDELRDVRRRDLLVGGRALVVGCIVGTHLRFLIVG